MEENTYIINCDDRLLIINPTLDLIKKFAINIEENDVQLLFLVQHKGLSDDNSYDSFIFFMKDNKTYCFHEYENPNHLSYYSTTKEKSLEDFLNDIIVLDKAYNDKLIADSINKYLFFNELNSGIEICKINKIKKNKI